MSISIEPVFSFLQDLRSNNNRNWFNANKKRYEEAHSIMIEFAELLLGEMRKHDDIETVSGKKSLYRIYRDIRFSKNKTPYKTSWSGSFRRASAALRGGYYFHLEPGNTFIAGGFWGPKPEDMKLIRSHIAQDDNLLRDVLGEKSTKAFFGDLLGEQVKTAPKGYAKDHPSIDLLRYKQYMLKHSYTDKEATDPNFYIAMGEGFGRLRPFFDVMSEILTTDLNGISLI